MSRKNDTNYKGDGGIKLVIYGNSVIYGNRTSTFITKLEIHWYLFNIMTAFHFGKGKHCD